MCSIGDDGAEQERGEDLLNHKVGQRGVVERADGGLDSIDDWTGSSLPGPKGKSVIGPSCNKELFLAEEIKEKDSLFLNMRCGPQEKEVGPNLNSNFIIGNGTNKVKCKNGRTTYSTCHSALNKIKGDLKFALEASNSGAPNHNLSFDAQCIKVKNSKKTWKKMREVFDLGKKKEDFVYQVEPVSFQGCETGVF